MVKTFKKSSIPEIKADDLDILYTASGTHVWLNLLQVEFACRDLLVTCLFPNFWCLATRTKFNTEMRTCRTNFGLNFTYFFGKVKFASTVDSPETIEVHVTKLGIYSQLNKYMKFQARGQPMTFVQCHIVFNNIKHFYSETNRPIEATPI